MATPEPRAVSVKLVLLGESAVGKSSLVLRYVQDDFDEARESTIGAAFLTQRVQLDDRVVKLEIWDTAGQERYRSLSPIYYRKAAAAVVCYDITSEASLEKAKSWVRELHKQAEPSIIIALTGNKTDLEERREVKREDAEKYAKEEGLLYFETSAKSGTGVAEVFQELARKIPTELPKAQQPRSGAGVNLNKAQASTNQDGCAC